MPANLTTPHAAVGELNALHGNWLRS